MNHQTWPKVQWQKENSEHLQDWIVFLLADRILFAAFVWWFIHYIAYVLILIFLCTTFTNHIWRLSNILSTFNTNTTKYVFRCLVIKKPSSFTWGSVLYSKLKVGLVFIRITLDAGVWTTQSNWLRLVQGGVGKSTFTVYCI